MASWKWGECVLPIPNMHRGMETLLHIHINFARGSKGKHLLHKCIIALQLNYLKQVNFPVKSCRRLNIFHLPSIVKEWLWYVVVIWKLVKCNSKRAEKKEANRDPISKFIYAQKWAWSILIHTPVYARLCGCVLHVLYKFKIHFLHDNIFRCKIANRTFFPAWAAR